MKTRKVVKWLVLIGIVLPALLLVLALGYVYFFPQPAVSTVFGIIGSSTQTEVTYESADLRLSPLSLVVAGLNGDARRDDEGDGADVFSADTLAITVRPGTWLKGAKDWWSLDADNLEVHAENLPPSEKKKDEKGKFPRWLREFRAIELDDFDLYFLRGQEVTRLTIDQLAAENRSSGTFRSSLGAGHITFANLPVTSAEADDENSGADADKAAEQDTGNDSDNQERVFSDREFNLDTLRKASAELDIEVEQLTVNQTSLYDLTIKAQLKDGTLSVKPLEAKLSDGRVSGHLNIATGASDAPQVDARLLVAGLRPADLGLPDEGLIDGGETDLLVDLKTAGASPAAMAAGLDGEMMVEVQRATFRTDLLDFIGSDLLMTTFRLINPFSKSDDRTEVECSAIHFTAQDGVLESKNHLVLETAKMKVRGGGEIDLGEETLLLDLVPEARTGLGINLADLASVVRIGGTLSNPRPVADPAGVLKSGLKIGAAFATGGVSLLAKGLFDRLSNAGTECGKIFEKNDGLEESIE